MYGFLTKCSAAGPFSGAPVIRGGGSGGGEPVGPPIRVVLFGWPSSPSFHVDFEQNFSIGVVLFCGCLPCLCFKYTPIYGWENPACMLNFFSKWRLEGNARNAAEFVLLIFCLPSAGSVGLRRHSGMIWTSYLCALDDAPLLLIRFNRLVVHFYRTLFATLPVNKDRSASRKSSWQSSGEGAIDERPANGGN